MARTPDVGSEAYWAGCRSRIGPFVDANLRWPGVGRLHRAALGLDLVKSPANVLLAIPALLLQLVAMTAGRLGAAATARRLLALPLGFTTAVERNLSARVQANLLQLDDDPTGAQPDGIAGSEARPADFHSTASVLADRYAETRRAVADLTTALVIGMLGMLLTGRFTPGSISAGRELADGFTHYTAVQNFVLGPTLGRWFYQFFPPDTSLWTEIGAVVLVAVSMSFVAAFAGLVADPLQVRLGLHQARLGRWLRILRDATGGTVEKRRYRTWDPYVARLADLVDVLKGIG